MTMTIERTDQDRRERPSVFYKAVALANRRSSVPTAEELARINEFAKVPLTAEQVYVGECDLCNDRVDRAFERFTPEVLADFAASMPGKSLMAGHNYASLPLGLWFEAGVRRDNGTTHLHPSYYIVKTPANEHERTQIDGGVYRYASIGFQAEDLVCDICGKSWFGWGCDHAAGAMYEVDGKSVVATAHYTRSDERPAEAVEGSIVYLGCQYDAELKAVQGQKSFGGVARPRAREVEGEKPMPAEHACRLRDPGDFEDDSFRRISRDHEGKQYDVIMGKLTGEDTMTEQAYRYPKSTWSADEAKAHCQDHDGSFEAASGEEATGAGELEDLADYLDELIEQGLIKVGRVLSAANERKLAQAHTLVGEVLASVAEAPPAGEGAESEEAPIVKAIEPEGEVKPDSEAEAETPDVTDNVEETGAAVEPVAADDVVSPDGLAAAMAREVVEQSLIAAGVTITADQILGSTGGGAATAASGDGNA